MSVVTVALACGGLVKGTLGIGMPLTAMPILSLYLPLTTSVPVLALAMLASNFVQMFNGGMVRESAARFWPVLIALCAGLFAGTRILVAVDQRVLFLALGTLVFVFAVINLRGWQPDVSPAHERWLGPVLGAFGGVFGGFTSIFGPPLILLMVALRLPKERFIAAIGLVFFVGGVALNLALASLPVYGREQFLLGLYSNLPLFAGMWLGQRVRVRIPQEAFRKAVLALLTVASLSLLYRGASGFF
ncbi:MAG: sulfite exporter TauE/SafE family protein [Acetobacterales bacterium]